MKSKPGYPVRGIASLIALSVSLLSLTSLSLSLALAQDAPASHASIVGLWKVTVTDSNGVVQLRVFDVYHSDRTEALTHWQDPRTGNTCLGAWSKTGPGTFEVVHPAFWWDHMVDASQILPPFLNQSWIGWRIARQIVTMDAGGRSFSGTFTISRYDTNGVFVSESDLIMTGERITTDTLDSEIVN